MMDARETLAKFGQVRRALNLLASQELRPLGVGFKQAIMIFHLRQEGRLSAGELGRISETDPAAISRAIGSLAARGWVEQRLDRADRRRCEIVLTRKGERLAAKIEQVTAEVASRLVRGLGGEEIRVLNEALDRLRANLSAPRLNQALPRFKGIRTEKVAPWPGRL